MKRRRTRLIASFNENVMDRFENDIRQINLVPTRSAILLNRAPGLRSDIKEKSPRARTGTCG